MPSPISQAPVDPLHLIPCTSDELCVLQDRAAPLKCQMEIPSGFVGVLTAV